MKLDRIRQISYYKDRKIYFHIGRGDKRVWRSLLKKIEKCHFMLNISFLCNKAVKIVTKSVLKDIDKILTKSFLKVILNLLYR